MNNPPLLRTAAPAATTALVLVVAPFEENAKRIESHLRNAGHKMRAVWVSDAAELEQHLQKSPPDLLMASDQSAALPLRAVMESCRRFAPSLPILSLGQRLSGDNAAAAVAAGARDLVSDCNEESLGHLERVYLREYLAYRNLRELARTRALLADYESRYTQLVAGTGDAVAQIYEGILAEVNPAFANLLGHDDPAALAGMPLMDLVAPEQHAAVRDQLRQLNNGRADGKSLECALLSRDRTPVTVSAQLTRGEADGERFVEMLIRAEAVQAPTAAAAGRLDFFNAIDNTGADEEPRAALFAVIDGFDSLEDRIGHLDAEQVAVQAGARLARDAEAGVNLFRFSTHEFALLVSRHDALEFEPLADRLVRDIGAQVFSTAEHESQVSLSITVYPLSAAETASKIVGVLANDARKLSGRGGNRYALIGPTAKANAAEREEQRTVENIRAALEDNRFKLAYQTIASLEGDTRQHFDVLIRMINDQGEEVHASDFVRIAEKAGLMRLIDRWVIQQATNVITARGNRKEGSMLFVKLSEDTLKDTDGYIAWFQELLKGRKLGEEEVCFEIQEISLQNHIRKAKTLTKYLRDCGASVAIEHFGIGVNSAQLLEHLPINFLKFHMSYTHNFSDKDIQKKMAGFMDQAKQRRIRTIVSHVEDANVMARMWQMGVNFIQGYHVQEPEVVLIA
ncbi:EAL domain-containing protein [Panacagrimonas sp.]|uniref:EAL domain-containing protein n=1 Tax=Panacagrimonas sp. TaxID=2480088 RepID=UPI003B51EFE8